MRSDIQGNSIIRDDDMMTTCISIICYDIIYVMIIVIVADAVDKI